MSLRFRRSVKLAPGLRLNFSGSGMSLTAGPRGASVNFGRRGTYFNAGIPGTGLSSRTRLDGPSPVSHTSSSSGKVNVRVRITLEDDGQVRYEYDGRPAPEYLINKAKREHGDEIRAMIAEVCDKMNAPAKALAMMHLETPPPTARIVYRQIDFDEASPRKPLPEGHGILGWLFKKVAAKIDARNAAAEAKYAVDLAAWESRKAAYEAHEAERKDFLEHLVFTDPAAMGTHFERALADIEWPRETHVSFEILDQGQAIVIDVDLPEIEDMPKATWNLPGRTYKPTVKDMPEGQRLKLYADHVQGLGFRIIGEAFALLPTVVTVTLSAYTQRPNPATGGVQDDYVYSVRVHRDAWSRIHFEKLEAVDVGEALAAFELRRDALKNGKLRAVEPFARVDAGSPAVLEPVRLAQAEVRPAISG